MKKQRATKTLALLLALVMLVMALPMNAVAVDEEQTQQTQEEFVTSTATGLRDYSMPSTSKHAYDPFAQLESEEATKAYRDSVQYEEGKIIIKVTETKGLVGDFNEVADSEALEALGVDIASAQELSRKKVEDGLLTDSYEVIYVADLEGEVWEAVDSLSAAEGVVDAQPNFIYEDSAIGVPEVGDKKNPHLEKQWEHFWLDTNKQWKHLFDKGVTAGEGSVVAVIDTGVDYTHDDLAFNMWVNTVELNGTPGVDDDGNGYVDDIHGVSTVGAKNFHSGNPMDDHGHGTHVAGIIAMTANNEKGGVGVSYGSKIMAIKAGQATGIFADTDIAEAINYAVAMGADVINMSFGGTGRSFLVEEALSDAFASCVLVASAGNDGVPTSDAPAEFVKKWDVYPAGFSYVLGVMATGKDGKLASFSNWDYYGNGGSAEYEITAPGVDIWSTLPGNTYAMWDGTSMAAPMVAAAAALVRSAYPDRELYSSRFIMGQLASASKKTTSYTDMLKELHVYTALDIEHSLKDLPKPNLTVKNTYLFDDPAIDPANDGDGIIDAGETIDLGIVIRNQWGMAKDVTVKVDAISTGGVPNPNIEWIIDEVTFENVGTFNEENNSFIYTEEGILTGVGNPLRFKVKEDTINDAHIAINITITATNALDEKDKEVYETEGGFSFFVQRGRAISGTISENMTLTSDDYWIIDGVVYIPNGVTVTVEPGTQIQFWPTDYDKNAIVYIDCDGEFLVEGTEESCVEMFTATAFQNFGVDIRNGKEVQEVNNGWFNFHYSYAGENFSSSSNVSLSYCKIKNPNLIINSADHISAYYDRSTILMRCFDKDSELKSNYIHPYLCSHTLTDSDIHNHDSGSNYDVLGGIFNNVLFDNCHTNNPAYSSDNYEMLKLKNCAFVNCYGEIQNPSKKVVSEENLADYSFVTNNAFLNAMFDLDNSKWIKLTTTYDQSALLTAVGNYYGADNEKAVDGHIIDGDDYAFRADIVTDPILTLDSPELENIYPFVTGIYLTDTEGHRVSEVSYGQELTVHVKFNRDMDINVQPMVTYGPAKPYTDYVLNGDFVSPREWCAEFKPLGVIDAGMEFFRVKDAVAADDAWLKTGTDTARFAFEVSRTGAQAMVLQAAGGENKVELEWMQDDYDTLAGFNVYRSTSENGTYTKLNSYLIPSTIREYVDTDVKPGVEYFYYFTVMGTDLVESKPSNTASATPIDNIKPTVDHARVTFGNAGEALAFNVSATDNIGVEYVKIFYRTYGTTSWKTLELSLVSAGQYTGIIPGTDVVAAGLEYYLEVSDGTSVVRDGSENQPIRITIDNMLAIYSVTPSKVTAEMVANGVTAMVAGVNFTDTMTLKVGTKTVEYTFVSPTQISFIIPEGNIGHVDLKLTDGDRSARLTNAITYTDNESIAYITAPEVAVSREEIKLPIMISADGDIISVDLQFKLTKSLFSSIKFEKADSLGGAMATLGVENSGVLRLAISSALAMDLSEPIGYLVLTPANVTDPVSTGIEITEALVNAIPVEHIEGCRLEIRPNFSISGKITYYKGGAGLEGVKVSLNNGMVTYTDANGEYSFTGIGASYVVITVEQTGKVNGAITATDASDVLVGITSSSNNITGHRFTAADVDGDGMLTAHDAAYILQKNVGIIEDEFPGVGAEWVFSGTNRFSLSADKTGVNFTGILLGDVNGDWTATPVEEMD